MIHEHQNPFKVIRFAVLVLTEDEDAIAVVTFHGVSRNTRTRRRASALNALASSQRTCRREARRNTIGEDQISADQYLVRRLRPFVGRP